MKVILCRHDRSQIQIAALGFCPVSSVRAHSVREEVRLQCLAASAALGARPFGLFAVPCRFLALAKALVSQKNASTLHLPSIRL